MPYDTFNTDWITSTRIDQALERVLGLDQVAITKVLKFDHQLLYKALRSTWRYKNKDNVFERQRYFKEKLKEYKNPIPLFVRNSEGGGVSAQFLAKHKQQILNKFST